MGLVYRREIDGLRAIAVVAVVLYHAGLPLIPGGFVGVDVFFVISGYLITSLLLLEYQERGRIDLTAFYARRVRRLLPALCVVVTTCVLSGAWLISTPGIRRALLESAAASLSFVANIYFQRTTGSYFDGPSDEIPLLHLWSLAVEEQFYLVLPLLLVAALRWRGRRALVLALAATSLLSLLFAEHWLQVRPSVAFFQTPARFWELAAGGLVSLLPRSRLGGQSASVTLAAGLSLILAAIAIGPGAHFPGVGALPAVLGTAMALWSIHDGAPLGWPGALLSTRPVVFFGLISYSLYLWHWPLLAFQRLMVLGPPHVVDRLALCALAVLLAYLSWRYIEKPFRRPGRPMAQHRVVLAGGACSLGLAMVLLLLARAIPQPSVQDRAWAISQDRPAKMARCHFGLGTQVHELQSASCNSDPGKATRVVIWGDSHALAWQPFAWAIANASRSSAASLTLDSCPPIGNFSTFRSDFPQHVQNCRRFNALATDYIRRTRPDTVILAGRWLLYFQPRDAAGMRTQAPGSVEEGIEQTVAAIAPHAKNVVIMGPLPVLQEAAPKCVSIGAADRCAMSRTRYDHLALPVWRAFARIAARHPNVELIDSADFFCSDTDCPVLKDGYALFWDTNHVSSTAAGRFAEIYLGDPAHWSGRSGGAETPGMALSQ